MSPQLPSRREAEEFARFLDGSATTAVAERYADLAGTVTVLRTQTPPQPRAEFAADLRARLVAEAEVVLTAGPDIPTSLDAHRARRTGRRERRLGAAAAALVLVGATTGMAAAAQGSLPGQTLYPLKRGIESVETHLSTSDATRGQDLLDQATTRLNEVRSLIDGPSTPQSSALVTSTLADFTSSADQGSSLLFTHFQSSGDASDIVAVRDFTHGTMDVLRSLASTSGERPSIFAGAGAALADIDQQARVLCGGCSDAAPLTLPSTFVDLTSASALRQLVTAPAQAADHAGTTARERLRKQAEAAQHAATRAGGPSSSSTPSGGATTTATPGVPALPALPTKPSDKQPLHHLLGGLVTGNSAGLGGTLQGLTDGVTSGLGDGLAQTTQDLGSTVGNTLGGVTGGLLGGSTTSK